MDEYGPELPASRVSVVYRMNNGESLEVHCAADGGYNPDVFETLCRQAVDAVVSGTSRLTALAEDTSGGES